MKSLDAICAKLQRASAESKSCDDCGDAGNVDDGNGLDDSEDKPNKRKNFCPKLVRIPSTGQLQPRPNPLLDRDDMEEEGTKNVSSSSSEADQLRIEAEEEEGDMSGSKLKDFAINASSAMFAMLAHDQQITPKTESDDGKDGWEEPAQLTKIPLANLLASVQHANPSLEHYITRFVGKECGAVDCSTVVNREHFHCKQCNFRVFNKKDDMLRHYKWHRKREESLAHGFLRFSASDSCAMVFNNCVHRLKQTHYHCLQTGCDKVYISTSDVQMHANSHRKAAHIAREGFQRYKASENCNYPDCPFRDPAHRTTHFHCLRMGCTHSFKNKADMDKHKAHHLKDEQLMRDGFKKFMKSERCAFKDCAYSRVVNHIHCIRPGCDYILHSTSQMYSHRRKHDKTEVKLEARRTPPRASPLIPPVLAPMPSLINPKTMTGFGLQPPPLNIKHYIPDQQKFSSHPMQFQSKKSLELPTESVMKQFKIKQYDPKTQNFFECGSSGRIKEEDRGSPSGALPLFNLNIQPLNLLPPLEREDLERTEKVDPDEQNRQKYDCDSWKEYITRFTANDACFSCCPLMYKDHYHCTSNDGCNMTFKGKDGVREHAKQHQLLDSIANQFRQVEADENCDIVQCKYNAKERHYHCIWPECEEIVGSLTEPLFRRLEHSKVHEYAMQMQVGVLGAHAVDNNPQSIWEALRRKRGRPSKDGSELTSSPGPINKSNNLLGPPSKRGRPRTVSSPTDHTSESSEENQNYQKGLLNFAESMLAAAKSNEQIGCNSYNAEDSCPDPTCKHGGTKHFHCNASRCFYSTRLLDNLNAHRDDFHESLEIPEGFACFDKAYNCKFVDCVHSEQSRHFHCIRDGCQESFLKVNVLGGHENVHKDQPKSYSTPVIKTSGIYFPSGNNIAAPPLTRSVVPSLPYTVDQQCGRPFCKLKRRQHYHCNTCSQGFSNVGRLLPHLQKHGLTLPPVSAAAALVGSLPHSSAAFALATAACTPPNSTSVITTAPSSAPSMPSSPPRAVPVASPESMTSTGYASLEQILKLAGIDANDRNAEASKCLGNPPQLPPNQQKKIRFHWFQPNQMKFTAHSNGDDSPPTKKEAEGPLAPDMLIAAALTPHKKFKFVDCTQDAADAVAAAERAEEVVPDGYRRYDSCSDCCFQTCSFKYKVMHLHCMRTGCGTGLIDKLQVTAHNELHCLKDGARVQASTSTMNINPVVQEIPRGMEPLPPPCNKQDCPQRLRGSHFHCIKCTFASGDLTKLAIHLKQHAKFDQVAALRFDKVSPSSGGACTHGITCAFSNQVHYHCQLCTHIALNHLQMTVHKTTAHNNSI